MNVGSRLLALLGMVVSAGLGLALLCTSDAHTATVAVGVDGGGCV
jgi:hypothetical protein